MELEHRESDTSQFVSLNLNNDTETWKAVAVTLSDGMASLSSESSSSSSSIAIKPFTSIDTVVIGENFAGLIQDVIFYDTAIEDFDFTSSLATFLPQCYCLSDSVVVTTDNCTEGNKISPRYVNVQRFGVCRKHCKGY